MLSLLNCLLFGPVLVLSWSRRGIAGGPVAGWRCLVSVVVAKGYECSCVGRFVGRIYSHPIHLPQKFEEPAHLAPGPVPPLCQEPLRREHLTPTDMHERHVYEAPMTLPCGRPDEVFPRLPAAELPRLVPERIRLVRLPADLDVPVPFSWWAFCHAIRAFPRVRPSSPPVRSPRARPSPAAWPRSAGRARCVGQAASSASWSAGPSPPASLSVTALGATGSASGRSRPTRAIDGCEHGRLTARPHRRPARVAMIGLRQRARLPPVLVAVDLHASAGRASRQRTSSSARRGPAKVADRLYAPSPRTPCRSARTRTRWHWSAAAHRPGARGPSHAAGRPVRARPQDRRDVQAGSHARLDAAGVDRMAHSPRSGVHVAPPADAASVQAYRVRALVVIPPIQVITCRCVASTADVAVSRANRQHPWTAGQHGEPMASTALAPCVLARSAAERTAAIAHARLHPML